MGFFSSPTYPRCVMLLDGQRPAPCVARSFSRLWSTSFMFFHWSCETVSASSSQNAVFRRGWPSGFFFDAGLSGFFPKSCIVVVAAAARDPSHGEAEGGTNAALGMSMLSKSRAAFISRVCERMMMQNVTS